MRYRQEPRVGGFMGLVLLALGVFLLLANLDVFEVRPSLSEWWPAILILFGIKSLLVWRGRTAWVGAAFWIGTGLLFLSSTLGYLNIGIINLIWPVMLIWFGVMTLLGPTICSSSSINDRSQY